MATTKKTATKGSKATAKKSANKVSKSITTANSQSKTEKKPTADMLNRALVAGFTGKTIEEAHSMSEKEVSEILVKIDRRIGLLSDKVAMITKHKVLSLQNWLQTYKSEVIKEDKVFKEHFEVAANWASFCIETKMRLNHVVVLSEREDKKSGKKETIRRIVPTMWVRKTDKVSVPTDLTFGGKVVAYRFNDKKGVGSDVAISDSKELAVTRSVKSPVMEVVTNSVGVDYTTQKQELNSEGVMVKVWEDKDVVFIPQTQLDFDFKEVKNALRGAFVATFGSKK